MVFQVEVFNLLHLMNCAVYLIETYITTLVLSVVKRTFNSVKISSSVDLNSGVTLHKVIADID